MAMVYHARGICIANNREKWMHALMSFGKQKLRLGLLVAVVLCAMLSGPALAGNLLEGWLGMQGSSPHARPYAVLDEDFYPTSVVWSPDGKYLADSGVLNAKIHIWDVAQRKMVRSIPLKYGISSTYSGLAWSPDGRYLVTGQAGGGLVVLDTRDWKQIFLHTTTNQQGDPHEFIPNNWQRMPSNMSGCLGGDIPAFSSDGKLLAFDAGGIDLKGVKTNMICVFSTDTWQMYRELSFADVWALGHPDYWAIGIDRLAFEPGTHRLAIGMSGYFGIPRGAPKPYMDANHVIHNENPNTSRILFWDVEGHAPDLLSPDLDQTIVAYKGAGVSLAALVFSLDGRQIAIGTKTGRVLGYYSSPVTDSVHIYDVASHALLAAPLDNTDKVGHTDALGYIDDGKYLLVGHEGRGTGGDIDIIDTRTFKTVEVLNANGVDSLSIDPSGSRFAATSDHRLMIWDFVDQP